MYNAFSFRQLASLMCWSRALLKKGKKVNKVEVKIKTHHVTYIVSRDFNLEGHTITIYLFNLFLEFCYSNNIWEISYIFYFQKVFIFKYIFLLVITLKKDQKIWLQVFYFIFFWYICLETRPFCLKNRFSVLIF